MTDTVALKEITQKELDNRIKLHEKYINNEKGGIRLRLDGYDISKLSFAKKDLRGAFVRNARAVNANFRDANMNCFYGKLTDFSDSVMDFARMTAADLRGSNLSNVSAYGAILSSANMAGAILRNMNLHEADMSNAVGPFVYGYWGKDYMIAAGGNVRLGQIVHSDADWIYNGASMLYSIKYKKAEVAEYMNLVMNAIIKVERLDLDAERYRRKLIDLRAKEAVKIDGSAL